ncbi:MAG: AAA family ATPase [Anaerolineae bacterium]|nr:AAA family ATPase [Anaerolineae bacterium]
MTLGTPGKHPSIDCFGRILYHSAMHLQVTTLGTLAVTANGQPIKGFRSAKVQALLVYLAVESGYPHRREALIDLLWSEQDPRSANTNFRQTLSRLQKAINNKVADPPYLIITRQTVQWNRDSDYTLDIDATQADLESAETLQRAIDRYQGDFLTGFFVANAPEFEDWAATTRENLHQLLLSGLKHATESAAERGDFDLIDELARRQLNLTPWDEAAHRALMQALAMQGRRNEALAQFDRCYEVLEQELGVEPSDATVALYEQIATGVVAPEAEDTPGLPQPVTPFVGRIAEINHIIRNLSQPDCRILTLTGAGGTGKTRLALAVAQQVIDRLAREVAFVSLVGVTSVEQAQAALAKVLGVTLLDPTRVEQQLSQTANERDPLLIFDNAEPLLAADGTRLVSWLNALIEDVPDARILVTSRQPLHSQIERVLPVGGLAVPHSAETLSPAQWRQFDAIALFEQRARHARVTFALTNDNINAVVRLCQLLNGLPLGIELAAAQMRTRSVAGLVAELEQQPDLLDADLRDLPLRHRSLHAVFEHSWQLLDEAQADTLTQCAVFRDGFTRSAARAVLGDGAALLDSLVDHALLYRRETHDGTARIRFNLSDALRSWLLSTHGITTDTADRHAAYYLQWATDHRALLNAERNNIAAAWAWAQKSNAVRAPFGWDPLWLAQADRVSRSIERTERQPRSILVGRDTEMAQLREAIRPILTDKRNGGLVTISGEAGIGKSHLVDQLRADYQHGAWFDCPTDEASAQALLPFRTWLHNYFGQHEGIAQDENLQAFGARFDDLVQATPDREAASELDRLYSFLAALVDLILPDTLYSRLRPEQRRENFQQAIKALIKAESALQPVIVHIEDGHWLDTDSAELVAHLLRNVADYPFAVIVTARPNQFKPPLLLDTPQHTLRLEPLSAESIAQLAAFHLDQAPDSALVDWLQRRGAGNPFFTEQLLHYLDDYGLIANGKLRHTGVTLADSRLPLDVHNVLAARLTHLEPATRKIVAQAAVLGREFSLPVLQQLVEQDDVLRAGLSAGEDAAIWHPVSAERYAFNHALLHDTAYDIQFEAERNELHGEAARAVAAVATAEQPQYATIAHHLEAAAESRRAAHYYLKAGDEARDNYFIREAHNHYSRGLRLAETDEQRLALYLGREQVNYWLGNREQQKEDLRQLVGLTADSADKHLLANITLRRATFALATTAYDQAIQYAQRATALAAAIPDRLLEARAYRSWGRAQWQKGLAKSAEPLLKRANRLAQLSGEMAEMALCTFDLATVAFYTSQYEAARTGYQQARMQFEAIDDRHNYIRCTDALGQVAINQHQFEAAIEQFNRVIALSQNISWTYHEMYGYAHLGDCYFELGDFARCRALHRKAVALARLLDEPRAEAVSFDTIGLSYFCENRLREARSQLDKAVALFEQHNFVADKAFALTHLGLTLANMEEIELAGVRLYDALSIRTQSGVQATTIDTEAALAWLDMARGDTELAVERARDVATWLAANGITGVELPFLVYHQCYTILRAAGLSEESERVLGSAYTLLQELAQGIADDSLRHSFLNNVPYNKQIVATWSVL